MYELYLLQQLVSSYPIEVFIVVLPPVVIGRNECGNACKEPSIEPATQTIPIVISRSYIIYHR